MTRKIAENTQKERGNMLSMLAVTASQSIVAGIHEE
jgi:hypothetical protein